MISAAVVSAAYGVQCEQGSCQAWLQSPRSWSSKSILRYREFFPGHNKGCF